MIDGNEGTAFADGVEAFTVTGKASRPPLPGLIPDDMRRYAGFFGLPSIFINLLSDHVAIDWLEPLGPTQTRVTSDWLFDPLRWPAPTSTRWTRWTSSISSTVRIGSSASWRSRG